MKISLIIISMLFSLCLFSQRVAFSLEEAKQYALNNNLQLKSVREDIEIAKRQVIETRGMGLPQISANGDFQQFFNRPVMVIDQSVFNPLAPPGLVAFKTGTEYKASGNLQVTQLVFDGSYIVGLQASKMFKEFQETNVKKTEEEIVFNVIQAYQAASVAKKNEMFADSLMQITKKMVSQQKEYLNLGFITQETYDQLEFTLHQIELMLLRAKNQVENTLLVLKLAMGFPVNDTIVITDTPEVLMEKSHISFGELEENMDLLLLKKQMGLQRLDVRNKKMANVPNLVAYFNHSYNAYRDEFNFFDQNEKWYSQTLWGLQLNIPIFSGLSRRARISQSKIKLLKTEYQLQLLKERNHMQEQILKNDLEVSQNQMKVQKQNELLAKKIYLNAIKQKEIGKGNSLMITQKYQQYVRAQAEYIQSLMDYFNTKLKLDKLYNNILTK